MSVNPAGENGILRVSFRIKFYSANVTFRSGGAGFSEAFLIRISVGNQLPRLICLKSYFVLVEVVAADAVIAPQIVTEFVRLNPSNENGVTTGRARRWRWFCGWQARRMTRPIFPKLIEGYPFVTHTTAAH